MGLVRRIKAKENLFWVLLLVIVNNSIWIDYTYCTNFHGNEVWYRSIDEMSQSIFCLGGIMISYKLLLIIDSSIKMFYSKIRNIVSNDSI